MRRLMPVGLWALLLAVVVVAAPGARLLGATKAYAYGDDAAGGYSDQDSGTGGGGGAGSGTSYGDPDGPMFGKQSRGGSPWRASGLGGWRGAGVYGQSQVGFVGHVWTVRNLILALRINYLRF